MTKYLLFFMIFNLYAQEQCKDDLNKPNNCLLESSKLEVSEIGKNILGKQLTICSQDPLTGFFRNGTCASDINDRGNHSVCAKVNDKFLKYSLAQGNDLVSPDRRYGFPGLKNGDYWCLCAARWLEAYKAGIQLEINKSATHWRALKVIKKYL
jgi:uncharacterized protein (DUF2237 family)